MRALKRDYAPSRTVFRLRRLLRDKAFKTFATVWLPLGLLIAGLGWVASQDALRIAAMDMLEDLREEAISRPEFAIRQIEIEGASPGVEADLRTRFAQSLGSSSLTFDAIAARDKAEALGRVRTAEARLEASSTLRIFITERVPRLIWRQGETLTLLDPSGVAIAQIESRADYAHLPLIAGEGADRAVGEAQQIFASAGPLADRLRGLVRVGERRWNMIIKDGPVVMLPAEGALDQLAYLVTLERGKEKPLSKDLEAIDLRLAHRPTLRLGPDAQEGLERRRAAKEPGEDA